MSLKFAFKLVLAYFKKFRRVVLFGLVIGLVIFATVRYFLPYFSSLRTFRIGIVGKYKTEELPKSILSQITRGLTKIDESGSPVPDLAGSWESQDEAKTWIFKIKEGVLWHDKQIVDSRTIDYEFSDVTVEKPNTKEIVFKLKEGYSPFPSVLSKPLFRKGLLGTGEYRVDKVSLVSDYVQKLTLINSKKERRTYKFYPTNDIAKLAFKLGDVDEIKNLFDPTPFDKWNSVNVKDVVNENQVVTIFFNTQDPLLAEKTFRQALFYAIDKDYFGNRALSPISPLSWAYNPQVKPYSFDLERAKELLGTTPKDEITITELKLFTSPVLLKSSEKIAKDWEALGLKVHVEVSSIIPSDFQAYLTTFDIPADPDQYPIWHSTQAGTNLSKFGSPRIDKILEDGRVEQNRDERKKMYLDFQRFLLEDVPAAFLYHPTYYDISRK